MIAGQWGDSAPAGSTISYKDWTAFKAAILATDAMEVVTEMVNVRNNLGQAYDMIPLASIVSFFDLQASLATNGEAANLKFEILATLYANHGPSSKPLMNAAEFAASWNAATAPEAMEALITTDFPGVNYAAYLLNKQLFQAQPRAQYQPPGAI